MLAPSPFCLQTRPTPPHLTSAMAENILAAACESETRKAAKRMRLEIYQSSQVPATAATTGAAPRQPGRAGAGRAGLRRVWTEGTVMGAVGEGQRGNRRAKTRRGGGWRSGVVFSEVFRPHTEAWTSSRDQRAQIKYADSEMSRVGKSPQRGRWPGEGQTECRRSNHSIGSQESWGRSIYPPCVQGW